MANSPAPMQKNFNPCHSILPPTKEDVKFADVASFNALTDEEQAQTIKQYIKLKKDYI